MSTIEILPDTPTRPAKRRALLGSRRNTMIGAAFLGLALMSITRIITDENALTSSQTIGTSLRVMVPILMAGIAALWAERCGVLNIGIEGMMILGTWFGGYFAWQYGAWTGLAMGIVSCSFPQRSRMWSIGSRSAVAPCVTRSGTRASCRFSR